MTGNSPGGFVMSIARLPILIVIAGVLCGFTEDDIRKAAQASQKAQEGFAACLQTEAQDKIRLKMTSTDVALYLKGKCMKEAQEFRVPFMDFLAMKFPDAPFAQIFERTERMLGPERDAAVKLYVESLRQQRSATAAALRRRIG